VIKNVAGYDLGKLFAGSYGSLGLIVQVALRLHPYPTTTATVTGTTDDPAKLAGAARALAALPLEADCLDVSWEGGAGALLIRFGGTAAPHQAEVSVPRVRDAGLDDVHTLADDDELWMRQRVHQRATAVLKVSGRPTDLESACRAADEAAGRLVGRAALGLSWIALEGDELPERIARVRAALVPRQCVLLDAPAAVRASVDPWGPAPESVALMRRIKERFDPARIFRPGAYVGGI
jgi:glycolate oxidase FAD binding subunit